MLNPYVLIFLIITITVVLLVILCSLNNNTSPQPLERRAPYKRDSGLPRRSSEWSSGEKTLNNSNRHSTPTSRTNGIEELAATL